MEGVVGYNLWRCRKLDSFGGLGWLCGFSLFFLGESSEEVEVMSGVSDCVDVERADTFAINGALSVIGR